ncbi:Mfa1 family fimbria major subunit [Bacteroides bouchesdurhonensis]
MTRKFLFMSVLASLFIAGCSQDEIAPNSEDDGNGKANTSYMAVNLMSSDVTGIRAANGYEDGSERENKVTSVRFYFFTGTGAIANVKLLGDSYVNYYDWTPQQAEDQITPDTNTSDDVESKLKAIIVINTKEGDKLPQMVAAVLNPIGLDNESKNLTQLKAVVRDYATSDLTTEGKFVMFNSVYRNGGAEVSAVPVTAENLKKTPVEAEKSPVIIYVERSVAKVRVTLGVAIGFDNDNKLALTDKDGDALKVDGEQVYLKLSGWSLSAETDEGRLVKRINPKWEGTWWNSSYRSFWAINSMSAENQYYNYNSINTSFGDDNALYTNENAQNTDIDGTKGLAQNNTKVILKGTLCKENGDPFTIVRHVGAYFADAYSEIESNNLSNLKSSILNQLKANGINLYYKKGEERIQIGTSDLQIVTVDQVETEESKNNCYVYAELTDDAKSKTWYDSLDETAQPLTNAAATINGKLKDKEVVDRALVWNSGMTYYYYNIKHLNEEIGVVRNHIYETNVTKIAGLGTPVYDPTEKIYPEKPDPNDHYIAAEIKILSWRIVSSNYELEW